MWIQQYESLISHGQTKVREVALKITERVLAEADAGKRMHEIVSRDGNWLFVKGKKYDLEKVEKIYLLGTGKGAAPILKSLEEILEDRVTRGVMVIKRGEPCPSFKKVKVIRSDHPEPGENSILGAEEFLKVAEEAGERDLVFCSITGGATSLVWLPPKGISLEDVKKVSDLVLKSGGNINEMNIVRRHLCQLKGGQLLAKLHPAEVITFSMINVPPRKLPWPDLCLPDPSTFNDAIKICKTFDIWERIPLSVKEYFIRGAEGNAPETLKDASHIRHSLHSVIDPITLCQVGAEYAKSLGYNPVILSRFIEGEAKEVGITIAGIANEIREHQQPFSPPCVLLFGGEVTVTVRGGKGSGGPNQEFVLGFAKGIGDTEDIACVAIDTDGNDGSTDIAGGIVDGTTMRRARACGVDINQALHNNDSSGALNILKDTIVTGPTGTNVLDFKVVVIG